MPRGGRRDAVKEKFWRRMVRGQVRSGLSIRAWCRARDLHEHAFYWWRSQLALNARRNRQAISKRRSRVACHGLARADRGRTRRSRKPAGFAERRGFVPIRVSAPETAGFERPIEIVLPRDRRVRVRGPVDRQMLADVLAAMEASPC
jgi:hypothetical protein